MRMSNLLAALLTTLDNLEYYDSTIIVFVLFSALMCSDSIFNLLKSVADGSFLFLFSIFYSIFTGNDLSINLSEKF